MHSYIGGVRDKNIGFAKIEVRGERLIFNISIRGMYGGASGTYGIYLLVDRKTNTEDEKSSFSLLKISEMNIYNGAGQCNVMVNPEDIIGSAYNYDDIEGMAIKADNQSYYAIFSLWNDGEVDVNKCNVLPKEHKKNMKVVKVVNPMSEIAAASTFSKSDDTEKQVSKTTLDDKEPILNTIFDTTQTTSKQAFAVKEKRVNTEIEEKKETDKTTVKETKLKEKTGIISFPLKSELSDEEELIACENDIIGAEEKVTQQEQRKEEHIIAEKNKYEDKLSSKNEQQTSRQSEIETNEIKEFEELFINADIINVFCDDDLYDCIEVTPQQIEKAIGAGEIILGNSFLIHGYYNFKHILFGRVADNDRHTKYFIGVPGIYCNRERYMASMFGFVNFKKSHRSDYANPHFGYWYQEI